MIRPLLFLTVIGAAVAVPSHHRPPAPVPPTVATSTPQTSSPPTTPRATPTRASRSRAPERARSRSRRNTGTGSLLDVTAYCWTGNRTASGSWPRIGMAAGNRWPLGTRLHVSGLGQVVVTDRIGHGSDLDIYLGHDGCDQRARAFGRRHLRVQVMS
ncbi:MAG: hypothetical protein JWM40_2953 [Frankiales bacterium]|nr:hypothetical protein [Frankiales bacterium]